MLVVDGYSGDLHRAQSGDPDRVPPAAERRAGARYPVRSVDNQPSETPTVCLSPCCSTPGPVPTPKYPSISWRTGSASIAPKFPSCCRTASLRVGTDRPLSRHSGDLPQPTGLHADPGCGWRQAAALFPHRRGKSLPWLAGIRLTLDHPELFLVQLKAMLRASEGLDNLHHAADDQQRQRNQASRRLLDQAWREVSEEAASREAVIRYPSLG